MVITTLIHTYIYTIQQLEMCKSLSHLIDMDQRRTTLIR